LTTESIEFDSIESTCQFPKSCPQVVPEISVNYDTYTYTNQSGSTLCITVLIDGTACGFDIEGVFSRAYLGAFNPGNACANYLADPGFYSDKFAGPATYSFNVGAGATFVVVVESISEEAGCASYILTVSGLSSCSTATPIPSTTGTVVPSSTATTPVATSTTHTPTRTATGTLTRTAVPTISGSATTTATPCAITFTDVLPTDYFHEPIRYLYCRSVISGYSDGTFRPYNNTTRGQLTKIVALAQGWAIYTPPTPTFSDVPADHPFYAYVETAHREGVISGYSDATFRPYNNVTRGQLSKIIVEARDWPLYTPTASTFSDVPQDHPFYAYVETAYQRGIISGYADGTFRPQNDATRGQISKIVYLAHAQP
jgi:hypothetical protein